MKNLFNKIMVDKWAHLAFSICISFVIAFADKKVFDRDTAVCAAIGCLSAIFIGIVKEVYDFLKGGQFDSKDLLADLIGCVIAFIFIIILL